MEHSDEKILHNAQLVLQYSRKKLALELPAFLPVVYHLPLVPVPEPCDLWTDGWNIYYHPRSVLKGYTEQKNSLATQLLHILIHGILGHFSKRSGTEKRLFDVAADIKAAEFQGKLNARLSKKSYPPEVRRLLNHCEASSLEQLYLTPEDVNTAKALIQQAQPLKVDAHDAWGKRPPGAKGSGCGSESLEKMWGTLSDQVARNLAQNGHGTLAGEVSEVYRDAKDSGVSYADFLRRFSNWKETQQVDPDSINRIFYHIGLSTLGDTPLVEPEEIQEDQAHLRLAVALDTSGSCSGSIMQEFLGELLAILRDTGGQKVELTLIQCDAEIQKIQTLTREDCLEELLNGMELDGWGGTDFRPVFAYVTQQRERGDEKPLQGLLYLSDGYGDFPKKAPDYPVAFLFPREEFHSGTHIPKWVTQVHITPENRLSISDRVDD